MGTRNGIGVEACLAKAEIRPIGHAFLAKMRGSEQITHRFGDLARCGPKQRVEN
jgi:hypothetical protein